ncbi:MAG: EamA family transporter [Acidimicrobiia bacterium]
MDRARAATLSLFIVVLVIGGSNFVAVRFSNEELEPFWGAALRFLLAGALFIVIALSLRLTWPRGRSLALTALYGFFSFTLSYALMYWALVQVTAGLAAVVLAIVPLVTPLLAAAQGLETLNRRAMGGAVLALAGILWMTVGDDGLVIPLGGLVAMLTASLTISQSVILSKRVSMNHPVMNNAVGLGVGAPLLLVVSLVAGESWVLPSEPPAIWAVAYLATVGSIGLFVALLLVIRQWTASATAYAFVLFPVVTLLLEAWLLDVPLTARSVIGAVVVMAGVWLGVLMPTSKTRAGTG